MAMISSLSKASSAIKAPSISSKRAFVPVSVPVCKPRIASSAAFRVRHAVSASSLANARVVVQGRHMDVTPAIKEYTETKVNKAVSNFEGAVKEIDVKLSASGSHGKGSEAHHQRNQKVEITVYTVRHGVIRVEDTEEDLYAAVDLVADKLKRKMTRMKEKAVAKKTWPGRGGPKGGDVIEDHIDPTASSDEELPTDAVAGGLAPEIVREKLLFLEATMTPEEAVDHLEAVGHDFFVFLDSKDGSMKIVYRRRSNGYGLLIPQAQ